MGNNNGSAFAGLNANVPFYDILGGAVMWVARFWLAVPILAIAGSLARKKVVPESVGTLPTHTPLFIILLAATVIIVGALTFFPALALGPIVEHLQMVAIHVVGRDADALGAGIEGDGLGGAGFADGDAHAEGRAAGQPRTGIGSDPVSLVVGVQGGGQLRGETDARQRVAPWLRGLRAGRPRARQQGEPERRQTCDFRPHGNTQYTVRRRRASNRLVTDY